MQWPELRREAQIFYESGIPEQNTVNDRFPEAQSAPKCHSTKDQPEPVTRMPHCTAFHLA
jgi:hypothetical protein